MNVGTGWKSRSVDFSPIGSGAATAVSNGMAPPEKFDWSGGAIGGQIGYNWQYGRWLTGVEADFDYSRTVGGGDRTVVPFEGLSWTTSVQQKLEWFSTLRARFGFLATDRFLIYGTGGVAAGDIKSNVSASMGTDKNLTLSFGDVSCVSIGPCASGVDSKFVPGWVIGGGMEWVARKNVRLKIEYLHLDFSDQKINMRFVNTSGTSPEALRAKLNDDGVSIIRLGLNMSY